MKSGLSTTMWTGSLGFPLYNYSNDVKNIRYLDLLSTMPKKYVDQRTELVFLALCNVLLLTAVSPQLDRIVALVSTCPSILSLFSDGYSSSKTVISLPLVYQSMLNHARSW